MAFLSFLGRAIFFTGASVAIAEACFGPLGPLTDIRHPLLAAAFGYGMASYAVRSWWQGSRITASLASSRFPQVLCLAASFVFCRIKWLEWKAGRISGTDFSHLDYAVWSTTQGRLMDIPFLLPQPTFLDMFGNHYSPILLLFAAARWIADSPLTSLMVHALSLSLAVPVLHAVARRLVDRVTASLLTLVYVYCGSVAATLQYDFHHESFYVLALGLVFLGIYGKARWLFLGVALTLSIKEDAGVYLVPLLLLTAWLKPERRRPAFALAVLSMAWLVFAIKVAMPWHQPLEKPLPALYFTFWSRYGSSYGEVIRSMLFHPHRVLIDLVTNVPAYKHLLPWSFLPLFSPWGLALLPPLLVLVTAVGVPQMLGLYYGITLVPIAFVATAEALRRWRRPRVVAGICLAIAAFIGGNYLRFPRASSAYADWAQVPASTQSWFADEQPVWTQGGLLPFLPYSTRWKRLDELKQLDAYSAWPVLVFRGPIPGDYLPLAVDDLVAELTRRGYLLVERSGRVELYAKDTR